MRPRDTSPEAWKFQMELMRQMTPGDRLDRALELTATIRAFSEAGIRRQYPLADDREVFLRLAQRTLGADFDRVFGDEWRAHGSAHQHV